MYEQMTGIDVRPRIVRVARQALADAGEIIEGDARGLQSSHYDAVLICDVLHMMAFSEQEQTLDAARSWLSERGVVVVRVADAAGRWRFRAAAIANRLKAIVLGHWRQDFYFRTEREWMELFRKHGLEATRVANGGRMPLATVLFRLTVPVGSATDRTPVRAA
jgi:hypothetical protein